MADAENPLSWEDIFGKGYRDRKRGIDGDVDIETGDNVVPDEKVITNYIDVNAESGDNPLPEAKTNQESKPSS